jgi:hypothetical protein
MDRATITIHLPTHRRDSLERYGAGDVVTVSQAYDQHIGDYVDFLKRQGRRDGFRVVTDQHDLDPVYTIDESDRTQKKAAHDWLAGLPDLWEWIT